MAFSRSAHLKLLGCFLLLFMSAGFLASAEESELDKKLTGLRTVDTELKTILVVAQEALDVEEIIAKDGQQRYETESRGLEKLRADERRIEQKFAQVRAHYDLADAYSKYKNTSRMVEDFKTYFRVVRGRKPNQSEIEQRDIEEIILEKEIRGKAVVAIGPALIELGKLITSIIEVGRFGGPAGVSRLKAYVKPAEKGAPRVFEFAWMKKLTHATMPLRDGMNVAKKFPIVANTVNGIRDSAASLFDFSGMLPETTRKIIEEKTERTLHFLPMVGAMMIQK